MQRYFPIINAVWFQLVWLAAIAYGQQAVPFLILSLCVHFFISPSKKLDFQLLIIVTSLGVIIDSFLSFIGMFSFENNVLIPFWLICIWCHFSLALNYSLCWMSRLNLFVVALFGAIAGPLNYLAGQRLGGVDFYFSLDITLFTVGVIWSLSLPVFILIQKRITPCINTKGKQDENVNQCTHDNGVVNNK